MGAESGRYRLACHGQGTPLLIEAGMLQWNEAGDRREGVYILESLVCKGSGHGQDMGNREFS